MVRTMVGLLRRRATALVVGFFALMLTASSANAETLLMPERDFLMGASEVVWGVTDQANGTAFTLDYGDGSAPTAGNVTDRSYIAFNHVYGLSGTFTVTLTVGAEVATTTVQVYNGGLLTPAELRSLNVNRTIHNGLRFLWTNQVNRAANFPAGVTTFWEGGQFDTAYTSLVALAFQNHGYLLPNNNSMPTGLFQKYVVRRALNFVADRIEQQNLTVQTAGDPCAGGLGPAPCVGLYVDESSHGVYETGLAILPFAASGALNRQVTEVAGTSNAGYVVNKSYGEILQRMVNAVAWGQGDFAGNGKGGWNYSLNSGSPGDGSSEGWIMLALLDAAAAGAQIPAFVKTEWAGVGGALATGLNNDGSFDYWSDGSRASAGSVNVAKTGVGLQGMYFAGRLLTDADAQNALGFINQRWNNSNYGGSDSFYCFTTTSIQNKGCGYAMFNVFKALKLFGVSTLANVNRATSGLPGSTVGDPQDWHADYTDWLVANQTNPLSTFGGNWGAMAFSSQVSAGGTGGPPGSAALALLILAPTALVLPDPTTFATVGLQHGNPLTINPITNPVGTDHTVTAIATAANGAPVATATINFLVISGPNAGKSGQDVTDALGQATFTYTDTAGPGTDEIRASIGALQSNVLEKIWVNNVAARCDADTDGDIDASDIAIIRAANRKPVSGPNDPRDGNGDGLINVADVRYCQLRIGSI
ncbi:MAG: hypothetical protein HOP14_00590 [Acidobacteria bacterium]|nr:hypothetical protein [Acidobacteriota bacterium]